eukprot:208403_1
MKLVFSSFCFLSIIRHCFAGKYISGNLTGIWSAGESYCQSLGSNLASIHTAEDNAEAFNTCPTNTCWLGSNNDAYSWTDGSRANYRDWNDVAPRGGKYPCVL